MKGDFMEIIKNGVYVSYDELVFIKNALNVVCSANLPLTLKIYSNVFGNEKTMSIIRDYFNIRDLINNHYEFLKLINEEETITKN